ncbi:hypothetical protein IE53DRAFT_347009 [Violaceomyces palustris]|uniref:Uncharacterized protein n=1 Tax=Violaceomyces palustris TaxID=1673888 RepID=A0ACD0NSD8_9BASI|nr:hypothetical protein IE53DRAFT_347009 [Violaceomyces palustris]
MEAIQKGLDQLAKKAPGVYSKSSSSKAAATNPSVHDSIDKLIDQLEHAKRSIHTSPNLSPLADVRTCLEATQKNVSERQKELYLALSKVSKAVDKKFPTSVDGVADPSLFSTREAQSALESVVLQHLMRSADWESAETFSKEASLPTSEELSRTYRSLHYILDAIGSGDLTPAIKWAESERHFLARRASPLEFVLHRSQFIRIAVGSAVSPTAEDFVGPDGEILKGMEEDADGEDAVRSLTNVQQALEYGRKFFKPFLSNHLAEIQKLFTLLAFLPSFVPSRAASLPSHDTSVEHLLPAIPAQYRPLLDPKLIHAPFLEPLLRIEFCARSGIAKEAPLGIGVEIGAGGALNRIIKVRAVMKERGNEWSQADELPVSDIAS